MTPSTLTEVDVYRWLQEAVKLRVRTPSSSTVHVSEVVGCLRRSYYMRTRTVQLTPANVLKVLGDSIHQSLHEVLRRNGFEVEFEVSVDLGDLRLVGHVDAYNPDTSTLVEIKTANRAPEEPYPEHLLQAQVYRALTSSKQSYIVYISRSDGRVKVFKVNGGKGVLRWAIERARRLKEALVTADAPRPERSHLCDHCEFQLNCWSGGDGVKR